MSKGERILIGAASSVIGGLVLKFLSWLFGFSWLNLLSRGWQLLVMAFQWATHWVVAPTQWMGTHFTLRLPIWAAVLLVVVLALSLRAITRSGLLHKQIATVMPDAKKPSERPVPCAPREPKQTDYTEDRFIGAIWRWGYHGSQMTYPYPFCPQCDNELVFVRHTPWVASEVEATSLKCERCGWKSERQENYSVEQLVERFQREIRRNLRTGDWRHIVARRSQ